ncbi:MAG: PfkB family carbohydrate kinase [Desulfotalea sp.]
MKNNLTNIPVVAGIGEILWDVIGNSEELGGAPVNFAHHANSLGAKAYAISTIGSDKRGENALAVLQQNNISTNCISTQDNGTTGYVLAEIDDKGVATYNFPDNVAWDNLQLNKKTLSLAKELDVVCFGSLAQRSVTSRNSIINFLNMTKPECLKIFDINLRQNFYTNEIIKSSFQIANIVKLNDDEIAVIAKIERLTGSHTEQLRRIIARYDLDLIILTRGANGSLLVTADEDNDHPGFTTKIFNTIGAGDSFTATVALSFIKGNSLKSINHQANKVASYVCSQSGAMPTLGIDLSIFQ